MKKHHNNIMLLLLLLFGFSTSFAQNEKDIQAKIKIVQTDNLVSIMGTAINKSNTFYTELEYSILTLKEDSSGNLSKNSQSGIFSIMSNETKKLSTQKLNIGIEGKIDIFLFIRKNEKVISKDKVSVGAISEQYKNTPIQENNIVISGLIIENVLTKPGRDFYELFNQTNRINQISYPFVILINEKPSLGGRNSIIDIQVNDEIVFRFKTDPKEDYLARAVEQANKAIYSYQVMKKKLYQNEKQF